MKKETVKLLHFGARGHTLYGHNFTCSGYEDPESFVKPYHWWADAPEQISRHWDNYQISPAGIPVVDSRAAVETDAGFSWVFKGPLLDVDLDDGAIDRLPDVSPLMLPAVAAYGQTAALLSTVAARSTPKAGPLDGVGVHDYVQGWRDHGARIGRFTVNTENVGTIVWEMGVAA